MRRWDRAPPLEKGVWDGSSLQVIESDAVLVGERKIPVGNFYRKAFHRALDRMKIRQSK